MSAGWSRFNNGGTIDRDGWLGDRHHPGGRGAPPRWANHDRAVCDRGAPFAVSCGLYGWMVHTRYFGSEDEARNACAAMKRALGDILDMVPGDDDPGRDERAAEVVRAIERFVADFPT